MSATIVPIRHRTTTYRVSSVHVLRGVLTPRECMMLCTHSGARRHHSDDDPIGITRRKNVKLPLVAMKILGKIDARMVAPDHPINVDDMMCVYRLEGGQGEVAVHTDDDFDGPAGSVARYSVLVSLNHEYEGGETLFCGMDLNARLAPGDAYLFRHDVPHEGLRVTSGTKFMLKSDVFVRS